MTMGTEFSRKFSLNRLTRESLSEVVQASDAECSALAVRLKLPAIASLSCRYRLTPSEAGIVLVEGWLSAAVTQLCVVTDEPFEDVISESFVVRLIPAHRFREDVVPDLDAADEIPYEGREIDLGELTAEQLALALPPYPRKPGAALESGVDEVPAEEAPQEVSQPGGAFAALAKLRAKGSVAD